jgi:(E)-4-hydroxy-3-methylbut-2-enyl-diphosphate synthase
MPNFFPERRVTRSITVGSVKIGDKYPVSIQSMITAETRDTQSAVQQIIQLHKSGAEIVRVTTPTISDAKNLAQIKKQLTTSYQDVPLVADVHHQGSAIAIEAAHYADKIRINPGLLVYSKAQLDYSPSDIEREQEAIAGALKPIIAACIDRGIPMRIGVNHGSLSPRLMYMYGDTPEGMVQSAMEYLQLSQDLGFTDLIVSMKASRVNVMLAANRLMAKTMDDAGMNYPMHLGVTEAGQGDYARTKSAIGIGSLLADGIGDTIRVSLTEDPVKEVTACNDILQAVGLRKTKAEIISCPGCGRTKFDLPNVTEMVTQKFGHLKVDLAVMGCMVNGPGEMADAEYGYVGKGGGMVGLYRGKSEIALVPQQEAVSALQKLIEADGKWSEPPIVSSTGMLRVLNDRPRF